jgi:hypothetical protein
MVGQPFFKKERLRDTSQMKTGKGGVVARGIWVVVSVCIISGITGCGTKSGSKSGQKTRELGTLTPVTTMATNDATSTSPEIETSAAVVPADHAEMKFFTEQYLPTNERLQRRQARLRESINTAAAPE